MTLWNLLYQQHLIRTWADELIFTARPMQQPAMSTFAFHVQRLIRALLLADHDTAGTQLTFVDVPMAEPSAYYHHENGTFYVCRFWLDFRVLHRRYPCRVSSLPLEDPSSAPFRCDHAVLTLYATLMHAAARSLAGSEPVGVWVAQKTQAARQRLEERPVLVALQRAVLTLGDVGVQWQRAMPACMDDLVDAGFYVVVHRASCVVWATQFAHYESKLACSALALTCLPILVPFVPYTCLYLLFHTPSLYPAYPRPSRALYPLYLLFHTPSLYPAISCVCLLSFCFCTCRLALTCLPILVPFVPYTCPIYIDPTIF